MKLRVLVFILLFVVAGCRSIVVAEPVHTPTLTALPVKIPKVLYTETKCRFPIEADQNVDCGDLVVPENRDHPEGNTIILHIATFHADNPAQPDPVIYLHGGPGERTLDWIAQAYANSFRYQFPNRDFIVFDQRGTGYAQPRLDCPSMVDDYAASLKEDQRMSMLEWEALHLNGCAGDLSSRGINLSAYNTQENAADLHDLFTVLGYEKVNLFGGSYGTYLAFTYMKDHGSTGNVRSVVLLGVYPLQVDLFAERGTNAQEAILAIFAACTQDETCNTAYPDLEEVFYNLLESLDTEPVTVQVFNPIKQEEQDLVVNSYRLMEVFYRSNYQAGWIAKLPKMLYDMQSGDYRLFASAAQNIFNVADSVDIGVYYATECSGDGSFTNPESIKAASAALHPLLREFFNSSSLAKLRVCQDWEILHPDPSQNQPAISDIPSLLLSGTFDPITPPAYGVLSVETLTNGFAYEFPYAAHGGVLGFDTCGSAITYDFLQNPIQPNHVCLTDMPGIQFEVP
jgi:pimeloyl-ACP methyl ester carboxylesterase